MFELLAFFIKEEPPSIEYSHPIVIEKVIEHPIYKSCILTARMYSSFTVPRSNAEDIKGNGPPVIGGLILLEYGNISHVAVIEGFEGGLNIVEGNYMVNQMTRRTIDFNDENIAGFYVGDKIEVD